MRARTMDPRAVAERLEQDAPLPADPGERFAGWGVMGLNFTSGHVLGLRRIVASSIGPAYTAVWHRDPTGRWTLYADQLPAWTGGRYYSTALAGTAATPILLDWTGNRTLRVAMPEFDFAWTLDLAPTWRTRLLSAFLAFVPPRLWDAAAFRRAAEPGAGRILDAGRVRFAGLAPNGQRFRIALQRVWSIEAAAASLRGESFGDTGPLSVQASLGDFHIPRRGVFVTGNFFFDRYDPARHAPLQYFVRNAREPALIP